MEAVAEEQDSGPTPVAETDRGTPVYLLAEEIPPELLKPFLTRRGLGTPQPRGHFSKWLAERFPPESCVIVKHRRSVKIFKIFAAGDVHTITARSIRPEDRKRLVEEGVLPKS